MTLWFLFLQDIYVIFSKTKYFLRSYSHGISHCFWMKCSLSHTKKKKKKVYLPKWFERLRNYFWVRIFIPFFDQDCPCSCLWAIAGAWNSSCQANSINIVPLPPTVFSFVSFWGVTSLVQFLFTLTFLGLTWSLRILNAKSNL